MAHASGNPTWVDYPDLSTMVSAAALERIEALLDRLAGPPAFSGYQGVKQTLAPGAIVAITFDKEVLDTHNGHDTVTNSSRYTIPAGWPGTYFVRGLVMIKDFIGRRAVWIYKNGAVVPGGLAIDSPSASTDASKDLQRTVMTSGLVPVVPGDYIEIRGFQDSGTLVNNNPSLDTIVSAGGDFSSSLDVFYVRP